MHDFFTNFWGQLQVTPWYEYVAVIAGIVSVWFSKRENVLVYPVGLISTIIYIFLSFQKELIGEASVNFYYSIMSLMGWFLWLQKQPSNQEYLMKITFSNRKELIFQWMFFTASFASLFFLLTFLKEQFYPGVIPWGDALATATAFTGMYLMVKKKVESWYWWLATNAASIPLYYSKGLVVTSVYYVVLLVLAYFGLSEWIKKARHTHNKKATVQEDSSFHIERYF
jgi:nicotinamide mononucleotide transporter